MCQICRDALKILKEEGTITEAQSKAAWDKAITKTPFIELLGIVAEAMADMHGSVSNIDKPLVTEVKQ